MKLVRLCERPRTPGVAPPVYEIAAVEAKYDAQIAAAREAGQDTAALEEQKEAEIYETRKKYAALQLAVKISEIIMNTAAGIMMAYASLPTPLAIPVAAMLLRLERLKLHWQKQSTTR